jgi:hypothetical protein
MIRARFSLVLLSIFLITGFTAAQDEESVNVLLVTNDSWIEGDDAVLSKMEELGFSVTTITDLETSMDWVEGHDFVYVSSTVSSGNVADIFKEAEVPVIMIEPYALDDMGMTHDSDTTRFFQADQRNMIIEAEDHFLAAGLSGEIEVFSEFEGIQSAQGIPSDEGIVIATYVPEIDDTNWIYGAIFAYEKGALMADTTEAMGRRYFAGWNDMGAAYFTEDGWKLWQAAIDWALYLDQDTSVRQNRDATPDDFSLSANFPNPFNPETAISFHIPAQTHVSLVIYNLHGEEIATLLDEVKSAGEHQVIFAATDLPSGIYFSRLSAGGHVLTGKMTLVR